MYLTLEEVAKETRYIGGALTVNEPWVTSLSGVVIWFGLVDDCFVFDCSFVTGIVGEGKEFKIWPPDRRRISIPLEGHDAKAEKQNDDKIRFVGPCGEKYTISPKPRVYAAYVSLIPDDVRG